MEARNDEGAAAAARRDRLLQSPIVPTLAWLAIPIVVANLLQAGYQLTDAFWVGRLGAAAVAAVSISFPVNFFVVSLGAGMGIAGATLAAQYAGAARQDMVDHVAAQTMMMAAATSSVLGAAGYLFTPRLLTLLGVAPDVYRSALGFMRISFVGMVFVFLFYMFQAIMRGVGETRVPVYIVLGTVLLNFVLDPLFIFGAGPIPALGVAGAALATLATQGLAVILGLGVFLRGRHGVQLTWRAFRPDLAYVRRAFFLGVPTSIELSARSLGLVVMSFLVAPFGTVTLAAYGVGTNILRVVTIPAMGLAMAVSTLVGQSVGAGDPDRATRATAVGAMAGFLLLSLAGTAAYLVSEPMVAFFVPGDPQVIADGARFLRTMAPAWGCLGIQLCVVSAFRASGNMVSSMLIALLSQWALQFPLAYLLSRQTLLGPAGLWWSFPATNVIVALVAAAWFARGGWKEMRLTEEAHARPASPGIDRNEPEERRTRNGGPPCVTCSSPRA